MYRHGKTVSYNLRFFDCSPNAAISNRFRYSEEVFSQHSRRHSNESGSELSDQEQLMEDQVSNTQPISPKRKSKDLLASPTHRKITPTSIGDLLSPLRRIDVRNEDQVKLIRLNML